MMSDLTVKLLARTMSDDGLLFPALFSISSLIFLLYLVFHAEKPRDDILVTRSDLEPRSSSPNPPDRNRPGAVPLTGVFVNRLSICILVLVKLNASQDSIQIYCSPVACRSFLAVLR